MADPTREDDEHHLTMLHMRDADRLSAAAIANRLGVTRNAVLGVFKRVRDEDDKHAGRAGDGSMPPLWWRR